MARWDSGIDDGHLKAIGEIVVNFSVLEMELSEWVNSLMLAEGSIGEIVTAEMSYRSKIALASSLCRYRFKDSERLDKVDKLLRRLKLAGEQRNNVVHAYWSSGADESKVKRSKKTAKLRQGLRFHVQEMSLEELGEIADLIGNVANEVLMFEVHMYDGESWFKD
jgi:hypothetical protein